MQQDSPSVSLVPPGCPGGEQRAGVANALEALQGVDFWGVREGRRAGYNPNGVLPVAGIAQSGSIQEEGNAAAIQNHGQRGGLVTGTGIESSIVDSGVGVRSAYSNIPMHSGSGSNSSNRGNDISFTPDESSQRQRTVGTTNFSMNNSTQRQESAPSTNSTLLGFPVRSWLRILAKAARALKENEEEFAEFHNPQELGPVVYETVVQLVERVEHQNKICEGNGFGAVGGNQRVSEHINLVPQNQSLQSFQPRQTQQNQSSTSPGLTQGVVGGWNSQQGATPNSSDVTRGNETSQPTCSQTQSHSVPVSPAVIEEYRLKISSLTRQLEATTKALNTKRIEELRGSTLGNGAGDVSQPQGTFVRSSLQTQSTAANTSAREILDTIGERFRQDVYSLPQSFRRALAAGMTSLKTALDAARRDSERWKREADQMSRQIDCGIPGTMGGVGVSTSGMAVGTQSVAFNNLSDKLREAQAELASRGRRIEELEALVAHPESGNATRAMVKTDRLRAKTKGPGQPHPFPTAQEMVVSRLSNQAPLRALSQPVLADVVMNAAAMLEEAPVSSMMGVAGAYGVPSRGISTPKQIVTILRSVVDESKEAVKMRGALTSIFKVINEMAADILDTAGGNDPRQPYQSVGREDVSGQQQDNTINPNTTNIFQTTERVKRLMGKIRDVASSASSLRRFFSDISKVVGVQEDVVHHLNNEARRGNNNYHPSTLPHDTYGPSPRTLRYVLSKVQEAVETASFNQFDAESVTAADRACLCSHYVRPIGSLGKVEYRAADANIQMPRRFRIVPLGATSDNNVLSDKDLDEEGRRQALTVFVSIFRYFCHLFEVGSTSEAPTRLAELSGFAEGSRSAFNALRDILGLSKSSSLSAIVEAVRDMTLSCVNATASRTQANGNITAMGRVGNNVGAGAAVSPKRTEVCNFVDCVTENESLFTYSNSTEAPAHGGRYPISGGMCEVSNSVRNSLSRCEEVGYMGEVGEIGEVDGMGEVGEGREQGEFEYDDGVSYSRHDRPNESLMSCDKTDRGDIREGSVVEGRESGFLSSGSGSRDTSGLTKVESGYRNSTQTSIDTTHNNNYDFEDQMGLKYGITFDSSCDTTSVQLPKACEGWGGNGGGNKGGESGDGNNSVNY